MYNGMKFVFTFTLGAAVGTVVTWKVLKTKYEQLAQEEIDSVKEAYSNREQKMHEADEEEAKPTDAESKMKEFEAQKMEYNEIIKNYTSENEEKGGSDIMDEYKPHIISPQEFAENDEYEKISLNYYADGVLTDDENIPIDDPKWLVGEEFPTQFGEDEDDYDSVFVRNDVLECDYEILKDTRNYSDLCPNDENDAQQSE